VTQQLRLVEPPSDLGTGDLGTGDLGTGDLGRRVPRKRATLTPARSARAAATRARRAASWGDWQLDSRTRRVGKEGVAAARRALEDAAATAHAVENHRQAS
jgi:hypothetical protein